MASSILVVDGTNERIEMEFLDLVNSAIEDSTRVGVDCEGVELSRLGTLEILSVCFESSPSVVYLIDFQGANRNSTSRMLAAKKLLESENVTKIIHDCRMDCDALFHLFGIQMVNIHDTLCFHTAYLGANVNLNQALEAFGLKTNTVRDKSVYKSNPRFWETRPLDDRMKDWAGGDVVFLFDLASQQQDVLSPSKLEEAKLNSKKNSTAAVDKRVEIVRCLVPPGRYIGRGGSNIRRVERVSGCLSYQYHLASRTSFMVYYDSEEGLNIVREELGHY